jgi:N-acetylmuramoyl-L-alanine amidase
MAGRRRANKIVPAKQLESALRFRTMLRVLKCGYLFLALLFVLAGCSTAPKHTAEPAQNWEPVAIQRPVFQTIPAIPTPTPPPPVAPPPAVRFTETWIPLERWGRMSGLSVTPQPRSPGSPATCALNMPRGVLTVKSATRMAYWDGLQLQLGFAPRDTNNDLLVHNLDLRKNVQPLLENPLPLKANPVIVIDPGHGGGNTGARNAVDGRCEKEFTLDWALRLRSLLTAAGWRVFLTRTNDVEVPLGDRVAFAERQRADLFISLHFNSAPDLTPEQSGLETYCLTPTGMPSNLIRDFDDNVSLTYPNNAFDAQNLSYAVRLHRALLRVNGNTDRGVRRARFMGVLRGQNRPAVLLEGGYLSNPHEARLIGSPEYRQKLAEAVAGVLTENMMAAVERPATQLVKPVAPVNPVVQPRAPRETAKSLHLQTTYEE